jgi:DNA modification methylase
MTPMLPLTSFHPLSITYRATGSIKPDPRNARTHPKRQVDQIIASMREFGFTNPILIDPNGVVIAGHGRLLAAKAMGLAQVPTIELAGLNNAQVRALRLADNKIALGAGWDLDLLKFELGELSALEVKMDLTVTGFSSGELDILLSSKADPDDDSIPPIPAEPRSRPGDIWRLGDHRIGCGDSRDLEFLRKVVGDSAAVDVAFFDPPYNVPINGHANVRGRHREFAMASGEMTDEAFRGFLTQTLGAAAKVSRDGAVHFICMDWRHMEDVCAIGRRIYGDLLNVCVWNKSNAGMGSLYRSKHELVFVYRVGTAPHFNAVELGRHGRNRTNVWDYASVNSLAGSRREELALHPTVKPTALVADAIQDVTRRGELVLDIFLGSGTTLVASERCGRLFRGLEIDPGYVDVAMERWSAMTGGTPELLERTDR